VNITLDEGKVRGFIGMCEVNWRIYSCWMSRIIVLKAQSNSIYDS
jgi:hypothetical protein